MTAPESGDMPVRPRNSRAVPPETPGVDEAGEVDPSTPRRPRSRAARARPTTTRYEARDVNGVLHGIHEIHRQADGSKTATWRRPDGTLGLNGTPVAELPLFGTEHRNGWPAGPILLTEGEKAAAALIDVGIPAMGTVTGAASTPSLAALECLRGRDIVLWPDNDDPGREHMQRVARQLQILGCTVRILEWPAAPAGGDAADLVAADADGDVESLVRTARRFLSPEEELRELLPRLPGEFGARLERAYKRLDAEEDAADPVDVAEWPALPVDAAYHGLAGDLVSAVSEHTEADPVAVLGTILSTFGALAGHHRTFYQGSQQAANLFVSLVGDSAVGRKGTAFSLVRAMFDAADPAWVKILVPGLGSGEGLIGHLKRQEGSEHRALVLETELGRLLRVMTRDGSTLSPTLRDAWDGVPVGRILAREESIVTRHHVGCLAHVTGAELRDKLTDTDAANGFGNRFLWLAVRRSRLVPFPRSPHELISPLVASLRRAILAAQEPGELRFSPEAATRWEALYAARASAPRYGLTGALTARAEAQTARLALVYALLDQSAAIEVVHLAAAEAVWDYAERSARHIFGDSTGDALADYIRRFLREGSATREELRQETGQRDATRLGRAIDRLVDLGLARVSKGASSGRGGRRPDVVELVEFPAFPAFPPGGRVQESGSTTAGIHVDNVGNRSPASTGARARAHPYETQETQETGPTEPLDPDSVEGRYIAGTDR